MSSTAKFTRIPRLPGSKLVIAPVWSPVIAGGTRPVNNAYLQQVVQGASVTVEALPRDRLLAEAATTGGDPLALVHLFGLSHGTAIQYCDGDHGNSPLSITEIPQALTTGVIR